MRSHSSQRPFRALTTAIAAVAIVVGVAGCAPQSDEADDRSISIGVSGSLYVNWNPFDYGHGGSETAQAVYDRLFVLDPATDWYTPWLAKEFELSEDGLTLSLVLRDDVDFVDGTHMDAEGVADYFNAVLNDDKYIAGYETDRYGLVFTATGEYSIEVTAQLPIRPTARQALLAELSTIPVISPEAAKNPSVLADGPVGSGPYVIKTQSADSITFERNPNYWNPDAYDFDEVKITAFEDRIAAFNALKAGQIDVTQIDIGMAADAESSGFDLMTTRQAFEAIYIGDRDGSIVPALADVRVRQAMSMALDREAINEAIHNGYGEVGTEPFTADQLLYDEEDEGRDAFDLEKARDLMAEAGYPDGFDLTIPVWSFQGVDDYGPAVQQSFSEIGITVTYEIVEDVFGSVADGTYAVAMGSFGYTWAWTTLPRLMGGFKDDHVDELIETFDTTLSNEEYESALDELGEIYVDELWFVIVAQPYEIFATNDRVEVAKLDVSPMDPPALRNYTAED